MSSRTASVRPSPLRERRKAIVIVAGLAIITGFFETATIVAIVAFIEGVTRDDLFWEVTTGPFDFALDRSGLGLIAITALIGMTSCQMLSTWATARATTGWQYQLQMRAIRGYMRTNWTTQSGETSGSLQNLMSLSAGSTATLGALISMLSAIATLAIFATGAFLASPVAATVLVSTGALSMLSLRPVRTRSREATRAATLEQRTVTEEVGQVHDLAQEIRVHHVADTIEESVRQKGLLVRRARRRAAIWTGAGSVLYRSVGLSFLLMGAFFASAQEELDVARIGVAGLLLLRGLGYGQRIQNSWQQFQNNRPFIEQVGDAFELYERNTPQRGDQQVAELGPIELHDVSYTYGGEIHALRHVDVTLEPGETLGIVGPSGSGKSTLAQILLGLREPSSGTHLAAGIPAMDIAANDWYRRVTVVPQQPKLLRASVLDNILFYRAWISEDEAIAAAKAAGIHNEILELSDGYDTMVGDAVRDLSGGQRQRLGIARALAGSPDLLVLDEPTSALDAMSEARVQETLAQLKGSVTVVIIAHRLATLNHCDRLLVLEDGSVRALDTPAVVMEQNDFYRNAVKMQLVTTQDGAA